MELGATRKFSRLMVVPRSERLTLGGGFEARAFLKIRET